MFGLDGARHLINMSELSGGQKARCALAALALMRPHILILDEPTNHLDMESVDALIEGIRAFSGGVVLVSHDARLISATECALWVCEGADAVAEGGKGVRVVADRGDDRAFERYRAGLLKAMAERAAAEERRARAHAERRRRKRADKVAALRVRGRRSKPAASC